MSLVVNSEHARGIMRLGQCDDQPLSSLSFERWRSLSFAGSLITNPRLHRPAHVWTSNKLLQLCYLSIFSEKNIFFVWDRCKPILMRKMRWASCKGALFNVADFPFSFVTEQIQISWDMAINYFQWPPQRGHSISSLLLRWPFRWVQI